MADEISLTEAQRKTIEEMARQRKEAKPSDGPPLSRAFLDRMASSLIDPKQPLLEEEPSPPEPLVIFRP